MKKKQKNEWILKIAAIICLCVVFATFVIFTSAEFLGDLEKCLLK